MLVVQLLLTRRTLIGLDPKGTPGGRVARPSFLCLGGDFDPDYNFALLSRSAFVITDTELKLIAAAAMIGLSRMPNLG
jgi:hypothetical protein